MSKPTSPGLSQTSRDANTRAYSVVFESIARTETVQSELSSPSSSTSASSCAHFSTAFGRPHSRSPPPFCNDIWLDRVRVAAKRAISWRNGDSIRGHHRPHCGAVSVLISSFCVGAFTMLCFRDVLISCIIGVSFVVMMPFYRFVQQLYHLTVLLLFYHQQQPITCISVALSRFPLRVVYSRVRW